MLGDSTQKQPSRPYQDGPSIAISGPNAQAPESEVQYAARLASESLSSLEKSIHVLVARLDSVLIQDAPEMVRNDANPRRPVGSRMGAALVEHSDHIDGLDRLVRCVSDRLAL